MTFLGLRLFSLRITTALLAASFATAVPAEVQAQALSCSAFWGTAEGSDLRILTQVSRPEKPAVVDLERVFPDLRTRLFIGIESWGHVFLQAGTMRLDGHVLSRIDLLEENLSMRHGLVIELPRPSPDRLPAFQKRLRARQGQQSISCVHEILTLLRENFGWSGPETIWLSDLTRFMTSSSMRDATGARVLSSVAATKDIALDAFIKRMRDQEQTWRDQTLTKFKERFPHFDWDGLVAGRPVPTEEIASALNLPRAQADLLVRELAHKANAGEHRASVGSQIESEAARRLVLDDFTHSLEISTRQKTEQIEKPLSMDERRRIGPLLGQLKSSLGSLRSKVDALGSLSEAESLALLTALSRSWQPSLLESFTPGRDGAMRVLNKAIRILDERASRVVRELEDPALQRLQLNLPEVMEALRFSGPDAEASALSVRKIRASAPPGKKSFLERLRDETIERGHLPLVEIPSSPPRSQALVDDAAALREFAGATDRHLQDGHTLQVNDYIERHLSAGLMAWLHASKGVQIRVYASSRADALEALGRDGFTEIREFAANVKTDFTKWLARDPRSGEAVFVVQTRPGRATTTEALAHFIYHRDPEGRGIDPSRIRVLRATKKIRDSLREVLQAHDFHPDIVVFGSVTGLSAQLRPRTQQPINTILSEDLSGKTLVVNGKKILLVSIEPRLFGDRAAELVHAVHEMTGKAPEVLFSGTAGALDPSLQIHDIVLPTEFSLRNHLNAIPAPLEGNEAIDRLKAADKTMWSQVRVGARHAAVDTILFEDRAWFDHHGHGRKPVQVVEQELADLARATAEVGSPLSVILRISDELHSGKDFSATERHSVEAGAEGGVLQPSKVLIKILDQILSARGE